MVNALDAAFSFHETALRVRGQRQEIIAANIANADTPKYKARDLDFKSVMKQALGSNTEPSTMSPNAMSTGTMSPRALNAEAFRFSTTMIKTSNAHLDGVPYNNTMTSGAGDALYRPIVQGSVDGNTVDMDVERNQFTDNALRYEASVQMVNGQIKKLMTAIQGQ